MAETDVPFVWVHHAGIDRTARVPEVSLGHWRGRGWEPCDPPPPPVDEDAEHDEHAPHNPVTDASDEGSLASEEH